MRLTIVPNTKKVNIDGVSYIDLDLSFIDPSIHAVQWKDTQGEIERWNPDTEQILANEPITDISQFQKAIDLWNEKDAQMKAEQAAMSVEPLK
jgi:hypothetical protein